MHNCSDSSWFDSPGGDDFHDVTDLFADAARSIHPEQPIFAEGYTLHDAMSALEIGEPRMDSGMDLQPKRDQVFNPLTPLSSQEVCWILDRSFTCEMEWHAGNTLSQTVYTFLYIHNIANMNPDFISQLLSTKDSARPTELVSVVLRAAVLGLLKSCALAWVELARARVYDHEDWHSEKSEISLYERIPVATIIARLEEAIFWLLNTQKLEDTWRDSLLLRIRLRKVLLELMSLELPRERELLYVKLDATRDLIHRIRNGPSPCLSPDSPATLAFDPFIARRLHSFMPIRVLEMSSQEQTWSSLDALCSGMLELYHLSGTACLGTWKIVGFLRVWSPAPSGRLPYLRSLTQTVFYNENRILVGFPPSWIVDRFFIESVGVPYDRISTLIKDSWIGKDDPPLLLFENRIIKLVKDHITSSWYNLPRRRRHLMNITPDWHVLHDLFLRLLEFTTPPSRDSYILRFLPHVPLTWRVSAIINVVFSGFQLDLYSAHEIPFAYWYVSQVIETQLGCIDDLLPQLSPDSLPYKEFQFQHTFLTALQCMSMGTALTLIKQGKGLKSDSYRLDPGFVRRYKWVFGASHTTKNKDILIPNLTHYIDDCDRFITGEQRDISLSSPWHLAKYLLTNLSESPSPLGWSDMWSKDRVTFLKSLVATCEEYLALPEDVNQINIIWAPQSNSAFPHFH